MRAMWRRRVHVLSVGLLLILAAGCPSADSRTSNQGGGDILTATEGNIGDLTADEIQILGDVAASLGGTEIPQLTDEQAKQAVDFLDANNIQTLDELQAAIDSGELEIPEELLALFS